MKSGWTRAIDKLRYGGQVRRERIHSGCTSFCKNKNLSLAHGNLYRRPTLTTVFLKEDYGAGLRAAIGVGAMDFNCSSSLNTFFQSSASFFISNAAERSE